MSKKKNPVKHNHLGGVGGPRGDCPACLKPRPLTSKQKRRSEMLEALEEEFERWCDCPSDPLPEDPS